MPFLLCLGLCLHRPKLIKLSGSCGHEPWIKSGSCGHNTQFIEQTLNSSNRVHVKGVIDTMSSPEIA